MKLIRAGAASHFEDYLYSSEKNTLMYDDDIQEYLYVSELGYPYLLDFLSKFETHLSLELTDDRNFFIPSDPQGFNTNPYSLAHGVFGMLFALNKIYGHEVEEFSRNVLFELMPRIQMSKDIPQGLFIGYSGISWVLLELGLS